jgi:hypothetical protein
MLNPISIGFLYKDVKERRIYGLQRGAKKMDSNLK